MKKTVEKVFARYGTDMTILRPAGSVAVRGFFRAANSSGWKSIESMVTVLGEITRGQYVYLGPAGTPLLEGDRIQVLERVYVVRRAEPYVYQNEAVYIWGLCVEEGVNDSWDTQS